MPRNLYLTITIPERTDSEFRRHLREAVRDAAARIHFKGKLDAEIVEEINRALPVE